MIAKTYIHIGLEKTGTTSVQEFLHINRGKLAENGIITPKSLGYKNHKILAGYALNAGSTDIAATSTRGVTSEEETSEYRSKVENGLRREMENLSADTLVFSSEDLSRLYSADEINRVVNLAKETSEDIEVIVFVRRQDLLASSRYYSIILGGGRNNQILPNKQQPVPKYYDYNRNIGLWIDAVGAENITLVRFPEDPKAEGFNSISRFCEILDIDQDTYDPVEQQHISYDAVNQIIMQNFNVIKGKYDPEGLENLMRKLAARNDRKFSHISSAKQARSFYERFAEDNLNLFRRLGEEENIFSDDFSMYPAENMRVVFQAKAIQRLLQIMEGAEQTPASS